jgi:intracellular sulfur oxidation DsrE/DsrF family protein
MNHSFFVSLLLGAALLLAFRPAAAVEHADNSAIAGMTTAKAYYDVNVDTPAKLVKRLMLINTTHQQLVKAGVKPDFVVGFRGKASYFVTKGDDDYILEEDQADKQKVREWLERLKGLGIVLEQCLVAAELHDIDPEDFLPQMTLVGNGYISMIGYQARGYALIPMY